MFAFAKADIQTVEIGLTCVDNRVVSNVAEPNRGLKNTRI